MFLLLIFSKLVLTDRDDWLQVVKYLNKNRALSFISVEGNKLFFKMLKLAQLYYCIAVPILLKQT